MKSETEILTEYLLSKKLKRTDQRYRILDVFLRTTGHISAFELHSLVKKQHQDIGFSTVYRTLGIFTDCGLAYEVNFGDGQARYEKAFRRGDHGHLICSKCGRTIEFSLQSIEGIQNQVLKKHGYRPQGLRFEIYGLCGKCLK